MDKVVLIPSAALGLILIIWYSLRCWHSGSDFNHAVMINIVFQSSGIVCGVFLIMSIFIPEIKELMSGIDIYIFVSGLAVFAVSLQGYHRDAICPSTNDSEEVNANNSSNESGSATLE
ncbi:threonyl-tRNA synthetase [Pseudoalteromonas marina]|uniref:threonyl-tRNA synthetase n=1 Tax=Pseudoalteromonas marina TaxID=267375 RepID=UPI0023F1C3FA|nr:threonyl-tRNA synthetase [Pseudoalteromonas marina]